MNQSPETTTYFCARPVIITSHLFLAPRETRSSRNISSASTFWSTKGTILEAKLCRDSTQVLLTCCFFSFGNAALNEISDNVFDFPLDVTRWMRFILQRQENNSWSRLIVPANSKLKTLTLSSDIPDGQNGLYFWYVWRHIASDFIRLSLTI